jgi:hypothetical protein
MLVVDCVRVMLMLLGVQHSVCVSCVECRVSSVDIILSRCDLQRSAFRNVLVPNVSTATAARATERFLPSEVTYIVTY